MGSLTPVVGSHELRLANKLRREFAVEQRSAILAEADRCSGRGDRSELLCRYGIYSSTLSTWRSALVSRSGMRSAERPKAMDEKNEESRDLRRRVEQLEAR